MVVLSAAVCTKQGRALVARQFVPMSRVRVEGLLAAFPKLVRSGTQHTYVETESVRYVYLPLDQLYVLCVTNKGSNILEDLETVHLISKLVPQHCSAATEAAVTAHAFDLVAAIDEVMSLGNREKVTLSQVATYTKADSHTEKIFDMVRENRMREVAEITNRKIAQFDKAKKEGSYGANSAAGFGSGSMPGALGPGAIATSGNSISGAAFGSGSAPGAGGGGGAGRYGAPTTSAPAASASHAPAAVSSSSGMKLGGSGGKSKSLLAQMSQEGAYSEADAQAALSALTPAASAAADVAARMAVHVQVEETISAVVERDGGLRQPLEIKGSVTLVVNDGTAARCRIAADVSKAAAYKFMTHPHIDKSLFSSKGLIGLKNPAKPFPTGTPLQVLRWKRVVTDEDALPLNVTCWPAGDTVSVQYELLDTSLSLTDVMIAVPVPGGSQPTVSAQAGSHHFTGDALIWALPLVDADNATDTLEFSSGGMAEELFFPVHIAFASPTPLSGVAIVNALDVDSAAPVSFSADVTVKTANYQVIDA